MTKLKLNNFDNLKTQIVKHLNKSNHDKTKKNQIMTKLKNSKLKNSKCGKTQEIKLQQKSKTQIVTVLIVAVVQ